LPSSKTQKPVCRMNSPFSRESPRLHCRFCTEKNSLTDPASVVINCGSHTRRCLLRGGSAGKDLVCRCVALSKDCPYRLEEGEKFRSPGRGSPQYLHSYLISCACKSIIILGLGLLGCVTDGICLLYRLWVHAFAVFNIYLRRGNPGHPIAIQ
jgi:hypothetical protein